MKRWLAVLVAGALAMGLLVWFMPARLALPLVESQWRGVQFEQVSGTLWQGHAERVSVAGGTNLDSVAWTLSRRALFGDIRLDVDVHQPPLHVSGHMHRISATRTDFSHVDVQVDMAMLGMQPWLRGQPQGRMDLHLSKAQLQSGWPMQIDASGTWSQASLHTTHGDVPLGTMLLDIQGQSGVIQASLHDDSSGPLRTAGRLSLSPLGWDMEINLKPRNRDPALLRWLHSFGTPKADGTLELRYRGGLAQLNAAPGKS
ncbi:type II secretion system protein N [Dyella sp. 2HG41-7]|uniref:type II secretion system protein N n=1 Tax=Dyella sp. 2HG41-7 TaxID=2883239 RepID=UPI001F1574A0|nr:type II secretion system protein N [Dyella sp. 2HG41-7]